MRNGVGAITPGTNDDRRTNSKTTELGNKVVQDFDLHVLLFLSRREKLPCGPAWHWHPDRIVLQGR